LPSLTFGQHLQGGIFQIGDAAEVDCNDGGFRFGDQQTNLLSDVLSVGEEDATLEAE
jgi:hypothetical protein